jgi:sulfur carrier protein
MHILINQQPHDCPAGATLADAIALLQPAGPFAAAVNATFVPRSRYAQHALQDGDRVEVIAPVTGG